MVGANLAIVLAFALFAVIMLTWTTVSASQIDDRVKKIRSEVGTVDEELTNVPKLDEVDAAAQRILESVRPLPDQATGIVNAANSINSTVVSINNTAGAINNTVNGIAGTLGTLQPVVVSIERGVATINGQARTVLGHVRAIKGDTAGILTEVGPGHGGPGGKSIHGHANSIDCFGLPTALTPVPVLAGQGTACNT